MGITVKVRPEVAPSIQERLASERGSSEDLLALARRLHLQVRPVHPGSTDPQLGSWFEVEAEDGGTSLEDVLEELRRSDDVEAAYIKPADELP